MSYTIDFSGSDREPVQQRLERLYEYGADLGTKVLHRSRLNLFSLMLDDLIRSGWVTRWDTAIDIGCNAGMYSHLLSEAGFRHVTGVDVVPRMIETARAEFGRDEPGRVVEFRLQEAETLTGEYDFVLCTEVIEHTGNPARTIEVLRRILAPGGLAVISTPNRISLPYLKAWLKYVVTRAPRNEDLERHLEYPFYRTLKLFTGGDRELLKVDGTNLIWDDRLLYAVYGTRWFPRLNRWNFELSRWGPFKYLSQFFYVVIRRAPAA